MSSENSKTKSKILLEATSLFCQNSYSKVTIKEISVQAECNIAAINYHFKNKQGLYFDILEQAYLESIACFEEKTKNQPSLEKIKMFINTRLDSALSPLAKHTFTRLINQEVQNPSVVHELIVSKYLEPMLEKLKLIIKEYLGPKASALQIQTIAFSIKSLCVGMHITVVQDKLFWQPHESTVVKNEVKQFIINSIVDYKKQIGSSK
ncbi:MAG: CerR family C-terminal domain-containing protein [Lentisphaeria bacterium]|nr:CerR family C-terminal domain-containing protein [Lentisphaeria bacterium]